MKIHLNAALDMTIFIQMVHFFSLQMHTTFICDETAFIFNIVYQYLLKNSFGKSWIKCFS